MFPGGMARCYTTLFFSASACSGNAASLSSLLEEPCFVFAHFRFRDSEKE
jgi:hypothetical protein